MDGQSIGFLAEDCKGAPATPEALFEAVPNGDDPDALAKFVVALNASALVAGTIITGPAQRTLKS